MLSRTDSDTRIASSLVSEPGFQHKLLGWICFSWGLCAYFPIGIMYLHLLAMLVVMPWVLAPDWRSAVQRLRGLAMVVPMVLLLGWTVLVAMVGDWVADTPTRLFHMLRVVLVLCLGMLLPAAAARMAFAGLLAGSCVAVAIVALHHAVGLPDWTVWSSLLQSRNNFSSGNMITMATTCGLCLVLVFGGARRTLVPRTLAALALALALALSVTVALHAVSRNAQLLLVLLLLAALVYWHRSLRAVLAGAAVAVTLAAVVWTTSPLARERFVDLVHNLQDVATQGNFSTSVGVRWRMYEEAVQGIVAHPLIGTGVGSWLPRWQTVWAELGPTQPTQLQAQFADINNPHNDYLLTGTETGIPGMLLLVWLVLGFIRHGWRQRSVEGGITTVMALAIGTTALVNAPFRDAALGMTLLWLLGASTALNREPRHA